MDWLDKYKPKSLKDYYGNEKAVKTIKDWIIKFQKKKSPSKLKNAILLIGPSGIGKTLLAELILKEFDYHILEFNSSDIRSQSIISKKIANLMVNKNIFIMQSKPKKIGIIMDEIEGFNNGDRGGVNKLIDIISNRKSPKANKKMKLINSCPTICICNSLYNSKINKLKKECLVIKIVIPTKYNLKCLMLKIIENEDLNIDSMAQMYILSKIQCDYRKLIQLLFYIYIYQKSKNITEINIDNVVDIVENSQKKMTSVTIYSATEQILSKSFDNLEDIYNLYSVDQSMMSLMIYDNTPNMILSHFKKKNNILNQLSYFYDNACLSNNFDNYINNNRIWGLSEYIGYFTCVCSNYIAKSSDYFKKKPITAEFTKILSKSSQYLYNRKAIITICNKLDIKLSQFRIISKLIIEILSDFSHLKFKKTIKWLCDSNIKIIEIDKMIKFNCLDVSDIFTSSYKKKISNLLK